MNLGVRFKNAIENFKNMELNNFQNGDINGLLAEIEFLTTNLDKMGLDEKTFNYGKDLLSKMQNVLTNQVKVNISTTIINSKFNEN